MFLFRQTASPKDDNNNNSTLLSIRFKTTEKTVCSKALADYIAASYAEPPEAYRDDLRVLDELRESATAALDVNANALKRNIRYYGQLSFVLTKFPADANIKFTWRNAFDEEKLVSSQDLYLERASVLFNIGALYSQLGCRENRTDKESLNKAFGYFQSAAGVFHYLQTKVVGECRSQLTLDLSSYMLTTLENLMVSQAQECVWQRSVIMHMKDGNIARIAEQVAEFYETTLESASQSSISGTVPPNWLDHFKVRKFYFLIEAQYRKSCDCLSASQYGEEVARLQSAQELCIQANELVMNDQRWAKHIRTAVLDAAKAQQELVTENCARAIRDNDVIYLDPVPSTSSLAPIVPYRLAQPKAPEIITNPGAFLGDDELGMPLFKGLVPFVIHQAASLYEDRKEQLVTKDIIASLDELTADCESVLNSLNLPNSLEAIQKPIGLPPNILVGADEIRSEGGLIGLQRLLDNAMSSNQKVTLSLDEAEKALDNEMKEDRRIRRSTGSESNASKQRRESQELTASWRAEIAKYRGIVIKARDSDEVLRKQTETWSKFFMLLGSSREEIERQVPSTTMNPITDPQHIQVIQRLRQYLDEVTVMKRERSKSIDKLKRITVEDDIAPALNEEMQRLAALSSTPILQFELHQFEVLFDQRLDKYTSWKQYVSEENEAQAELLDSIREANQAFITARTSHPLLQQREKALVNLETAIKRYRDISYNLHDGSRFYSSLEGELGRLREQCIDFAMARHLDAQDLLGVNGADLPEDLAQAPDSPHSPRSGTVDARGSTSLQQQQQQQQPQGKGVWDPSMPLRYTTPR